MSDLPPILSAALLLGMVCAVFWAIAETMRRLAVRGSRARYVWASAERAARWPALLYLVLSTIVEGFYGTKTMAVIDCFGVALWIWVHHEKRDDHDDDYWSDLKKKMQGWATGLGTAIGGVR